MMKLRSYIPLLAAMLAAAPAFADTAPAVADKGDTAWMMTSSLLVLFMTRISRNLRARDAYVAELRQLAAEEDSIVRMGLFASGAAHELGTPLATMSLVTGELARDAQLPAALRDDKTRMEQLAGVAHAA